MTDAAARLLAMGDEKFVRLTTFRRTGEPVHTAVWIARDGERLLVTTGADSGKIKRLKHSPRVELTPCDRSGTVVTGAAAATGAGLVDPSPATRSVLNKVMGKKYGLLFQVFRIVAGFRGSEKVTAVVIRPV